MSNGDYPKKRQILRRGAIMNAMIATDDPLKERAYPISGDVNIRSDIGGSGLFESSRIREGKSVKGAHRGIDISVPFGSRVNSPFAGTVTKIGMWYKGDTKTKYVEVKTGSHVMRFAYVDPSVKKGDVVKAGDILGKMRRPGRWQKNISDHVHVEVVEGSDFIKSKRINPTELLGAIR